MGSKSKEAGGLETADLEGSAQAAKPKYLAKRQGLYWFRRKVPAGLEHAFPEAESGDVWRSLKTSDFAEACRKLPEKVAAFEKQCGKGSKHAGKPSRRAGKSPKKAQEASYDSHKYLLPEHISVILTRYRQSVLAGDDEERREIGLETRRDAQARSQELAHRRELLEQQLAHYKASAAVCEWDVVEELANGILEVDELIAPPGSVVRQTLVEELLRLEIQLLRELLLRLDGEGVRTPPAAEYPLPPRALMTMKDALRIWADSQDLTQTIETYEHFVEEFESVVGRIPLIAIGREHVYSYRTWLEGKEIKRDTAKNRIGGLATVFDYAIEEAAENQHLTGKANPFAGVRLANFDGTAAHERRRPFTVPELQKFFESAMYTGEYRPEGQASEALYWAPLIATFTGARLEEIAQLRVDNIGQVEGVWAIHFWESEAGQRLKTRSSFRRVPIHSELLDCGLLDYLNSLGGQQRLFPSLRNENKREKWSAAVSSRFAAYMDRIGLSDDRLDFHSFRYTFRQQCTNCGIQNETRDALTGHWAGDRDAGKTYLKAHDSQYPFPALLAAIEAFKYTGLKLAALKTVGRSSRTAGFFR